MEDEKFQIATSGSVFNAGNPLLMPFTKSVKSIAPHSEIIHPRSDPVTGALFLALREAGVELSDDVLSKITSNNSEGQ